MILEFSPAQLGVIVACLEIEGSEYAAPSDVRDMCQYIKNSVYDSLGDTFYEMWLDEFDILE